MDDAQDQQTKKEFEKIAHGLTHPSIRPSHTHLHTFNSTRLPSMPTVVVFFGASTPPLSRFFTSRCVGGLTREGRQAVDNVELYMKVGLQRVR